METTLPVQSDIQLKVENGLAIISFDAKDKKVNILSAQVLEELKRLIRDVQHRKDIKALIFRSAKPKVFIAGADIKEIESIEGAASGEEKSSAGHKLLNAIEDLPFPSAALINGVCLGGGLELALACTYRFAAQNDSVRMGLPETKLGIFPGFGGTVRLPKLVGLQKGLEMILQGKALDAGRAYRLGLVNGLASDELLRDIAVEFLVKNKFKKLKPRKPRMPLIMKLLENTLPGRKFIRFLARKNVLKMTRGHYPAVLKAIDVVVANYGEKRSVALDLEAKEFGRLISKGGHKNLIRTFYLMERYKKEKWSEADALPIHKCGVVGAGVMGGGIAQLVSSTEIPVRLKDVNHEALLLGLKSASHVYRGLVERRRLKPAEARTRMGLILPTVEYTGFKRCDIVIEAVIEKMDIKKKVFSDLDAIVPERTILASNTSSLSVTEMARNTKDPSRVVGMHFFNPVHKMPLVEIIRGEKTSEEAIQTIVQFSRKLKKTPIVVKDAPGFLVNRVLLPFLNEAGHLLEEGESMERMDRILLDFGMPMGAFILLDEIGLDVASKVAEILRAAFGERMKVSKSFEKIANKKWLGRKSGKGFYIHQGRKRTPNPAISDVLGVRQKTLKEEDILTRLMSVMINEACLCLEDGVTREAQDVDIGMLMGTGFPPFRGGLLRYADSLGADKIVASLERHQQNVDPHRFKPSNLLLEMKKSHKKFHSG